jgi:RNase adapter protein RapZ
MTDKPIQFFIITGLSGAGKSTAIRFFEDAGFFCVDNLPPTLLPKFAQLCKDTHGKIHRVAVVTDIRGGEFFSNLFEALAALDEIGLPYRIIYLEAEDDVLIRRFSETRRRHPLSSGGQISDDIAYERRCLTEVRDRADFVINTTTMSSRELYEEIRRVIEQEDRIKRLSLIFVSFGFKHGIPLDSDMVFDLRFLPNPNYVADLKPFTGLDPKVFDYVMAFEVSQEFLRHLTGFIEYLLPHFIQEGKSRLQISIGCTGGRHRSVAFTENFYRTIRHDAVDVYRRHRDLELA